MRFALLCTIFWLMELAYGDTPANCTKSDIEGEWIFYVGQLSKDPNIDCSNMPSVMKKLKITLNPDDTAMENKWVVGKWTMIYNQGFEVNVNWRTYFAFSKYKQEGSNVTSICTKTFTGKSHDVTLRNYNCFYGIKQGPSLYKIDKDPFYKESVHEARRHSRQEHENIVKQVNEKQSSWFAQIYEPFVAKSPEELLYIRGGPRSFLAYKIKANMTKGYRLLDSNMVDSLDWRNFRGENFISPVRNQGLCGSCYAFSSAGMIESRIRIATMNANQVILSPQDIISCTELAQGCDGGFPYLIAGRYGWETGLAEEACSPYKGYNDTCTKSKCEQNRTYTAEYAYVGGAYGRSNEDAMKKALLKGPISVSFEVYPDFMHYKSGIYHYTEIQGLEPFIVVNHAVLLVGYGVDEATGQKYWIVKNSWGEDWGEQGYFRIRRGVDEVGIESCAVEAFPIPT